MDFFNAALERIERVLYGVDEWLRFRGGDRRSTLLVKAVFGLAWAVIAYVARIYVNLLIEPQVNPIKHFPVVTVSHKIIVPFWVPMIRIGRTLVTPILGLGLATTFATVTVFLLPGVFGFLVWELKENWRLYAANRPPTLRPVAFGHHGETMSRLLRRGFHSGTIPKLFARLRKAERRAERGRGEGPAEKRIEQIHHVAEAIHQCVDRGFVYVLEECRAAGTFRPTVGEVECATNRVVVELRGAGGEGPARPDRLRRVEPAAPRPPGRARLALRARRRRPACGRVGAGRALRDERRGRRDRAGHGRGARRAQPLPGVVGVGRVVGGRRRRPRPPDGRPGRRPPPALPPRHRAVERSMKSATSRLSLASEAGWTYIMCPASYSSNRRFRRSAGARSMWAKVYSVAAYGVARS